MSARCFWLLCAFLSPLSIACGGVEILPGQIELMGKLSSQRLLLEVVTDGAYTQQLNENVEWTTENPDVAVVEKGIVYPRGNGSTKISASWSGKRAVAEVTVKDFDSPHRWNFRENVESVLAKSGCNAGACHGALAGKGGFKLTLGGYDPSIDFHSISKQARGRRIDFSEPGKSLLLTKPTGAVPHKGGVRFETDSREYRILSEWIASGAPGPSDEDPTVSKLEIFPDQALVEKGGSQQLIVRATYSDGHKADVTPWVKFSSTDEVVAKVDDQGLVTVHSSGEGAVTAWFASKIVVGRISSPYPHKVPEEHYAQAPRRNFIDDLVSDKLKRLHLQVSPRSSDSEFLRRVYVDTIGLIPTEEEARQFLADTSPDKRDKLIDALLARPEFVDYWSYKWSDLLLINGTRLRPANVKAYYGWVRKHVESNTPWDQLVREILTAQGSTHQNGATNFYALHQDPENLTENASQAFLGLSIGCAKCHNHPLEKWTNNQYYAMANLFARVRSKGWGGEPRSGDGNRVVYVVSRGELIQPLTGKPQPPTPLDGEPIPFESPDDRRVYLANWMTSPQNTYFSRAITNRVWANFLGSGLVEPVDDLRISNPASNEELLSALANHLVESKFDLKILMKTIMQSETYQRSSQAVPGNQEDPKYYSRYYPRRIMAEVLLDAVSQVSQVPTDFNEIAFPGGDKEATAEYAKGTRALQLYDSAIASNFLKVFGRNPRQITCECERTDEPSMVQVLHISNGDTLNAKLAMKDNRIDRLLASGKKPEEIVDSVFLLCLARNPTDREKNEFVTIWNETPEAERRVLLEDIFWATMSSREFLFQH